MHRRSVRSNCYILLHLKFIILFTSLVKFASRIASEQRDAERRKREFAEIEKAVALTKRKFKQETTEVMLGVSSFDFKVGDVFICYF